MQARLPKLTVLILTYLLLGIANSVAELRWTVIGDDLEQLNLSCPSSAPVLAPKLTLIRSSLKRYRVAVIRASEFAEKRLPLSELCQKGRAAACINANFFDEQGKALGLVISRGIVHQKLHRFGNTMTAVFQSGIDGVKIIQRDSFQPEGIVEAVQAGPRFVVNGAATKGVQENLGGTNLSGLCIDNHQRLIIYRLTTSLFGCGIDQVQQLLIQAPVACQEALNLDGGGSSSMYVSPEVVGRAKRQLGVNLIGTDPVPVAIGIVGR